MKKAATFDRPAAALIEDLEQRGLLEDTLVLCTGEFGRTPFREGRTAASSILGRDHYPDCYSVWMAGGGVKAGHVHGASDDLGFKIASDMVHIHDLQATILHLLGFDHTKLTYRFQGRDFRLTDVHGQVVKSILT
jgi:arylsulfatase A-like enzyme